MYLRQKREHLVLGLTTNDRGDWQKSYFFVRGKGVFGSNGRGEIPEHWSSSSEYFHLNFDTLYLYFEWLRISLFLFF